jgi:thioesterase domain-containing protein/acyl carrier protein
VSLENMPLTPNGKVNRGALPKPDREAFETSAGHVGPRNEDESLLASLWEQILGRGRIGIYDNFFELGGHSLLAAQLIVRVRKTFGVKLPLLKIFEGPTVAQLVEIISELSAVRDDSEEVPCIVPIKHGNDSNSIFFMHPVGGGVSAYTELARLLTSPSPMFAVRAESSLYSPDHLNSLSDAVAFYAAAVERVQSNGPYILAGWSHGGLVAFEMAQQLRRRGREVTGVFLIDTQFPTGTIPEYSDEDLATVYSYELARQVGIDLNLDLTTVGPDPERRLEHIVNVCRELRILPDTTNVETVRKLIGELRCRERMGATYHPQPYDGMVFLFRAKESRELTGVPTAGLIEESAWAEVCKGGLKVVDVAGDHYTVLSHPYIPDIAGKIDETLASLKVVRLKNATANG